MILQIEDGILLKPYSLAWQKEGYSPPPAGWTPVDREELNQYTFSLMRRSDRVQRIYPPRIARLKALAFFEDKHHATKKPWDGWVPVIFQRDRRIGMAYRALFVALNPDKNEIELTVQARTKKNVIWPGDGYYEFANGKLRSLPDYAEGE